MKSFFRTDSVYSMGRLLCLLSVLGGIVTGVLLALNGKLDTAGASFCGGLVIAGIGGKNISERKK